MADISTPEVVYENVPAGEAAPPVSEEVQDQGNEDLLKHGEEGTDQFLDKVSPVKITKGRNEKKIKLTDEDENSEDDSDEEFPNDKLLRGKDMKKGKQADVDIVPPEKRVKKAKKSPNKVTKPRIVRKVIKKWNVRRTRMNPECTNYREIHENCSLCR